MESNLNQDWFVYIVETDKKHLYTGVTTDVQRRFTQHTEGRGAKFFRMHTPKKIVYTEKCDCKETALKKEKRIKALTAIEKKKLISGRA